MVFHIPIQILSIQEDGFHLAVEAMLGDHLIHMLVDTGASRTVFDEKLLKDLLNLKDEDIHENPGPSGGIGTTTLESSVTVIPDFRLGDLHFTSYQAALIDLEQVNQLFSAIGLPPVDGILGGDILLEHKAVIDYGKKVLKLKSKRTTSRRSHLMHDNDF